MNKNHLPLTRRDFVRDTLGTAVGTSVFSSGLAAGQKRPARSSRVIVVRHQSALTDGNKVNVLILKKLLEEIVTRTTGQQTIKSAWLSLVRPADVVGLVPTPHLNPTHKELIDAVEASLIDAGVPKDRIRQAQGGPNLPQACTALIALPALKAHWLTGIGTVLKNYITFSGNPEAYHDENNVKLGEIWNLPSVKGKTKLILVDALRPLCDKGPQPDPRYMWPYSGLIAGTDPVAVETVCLQIITKKRELLRKEPWPLTPPPLCVAAADVRYNLGTSRLEEIKVEKYGWSENLLL